MKEQKKGSPLGTLWSWGKAHHGKFVFSIILAILGVACQMIPYFCVVNVISKMFAGETAFSAYLPVCLVALTGYCGKVLFSNLSTVISHNAAYSTLRDLRERVVEKLAKVPMGTILDTPSGHYKSIIVDRIEGMEVPFAHLLPVWIIILGALFAIGVGKMSFGGLGCNPFNPALAGRVFLLLSFPVQMTSWPVVGQLTAYTDATTGATPLALMKQAIYGNTDALSQIPDALSLLIGQNGGCLGEVSALALLIGLAYMLWKKIITWHIPVSILVTVFVFAGIMHLADPEKYVSPVLQLLSGGLMLGAVFMATDYVYRDYRLEVEFRVSFDDFRRLCVGCEPNGGRIATVESV